MKIPLILICLSFFISISLAQEQGFILFTDQEIQKITTQSRENEAIQNSLETLNHWALKAQAKEVLPLTSVAAPLKGLDSHAYFSESPYWWPDSSNPDGPFIRRDGLRFPGRFQGHKQLFMAMYQNLTALSLHAYFEKDEASARKAREILRVWFVNGETRMAPHLQHAQAIRNRVSGRSFGIIETHRFTELMPALRFLAATGKWPVEEQRQVKHWFRAFLRWLIQSEFGQKEKMHGNNHSTWWSAQVMAIAEFLGEDSVFSETRQHVENYLLEKQLAAPGRFPLEEERTRSFDYTIFNLNAYAYIAQMIRVREGANLWHETNGQQVSLADVVGQVLPYLKQPGSWPGEQILPTSGAQAQFLFFYALAEQSQSLLNAYRHLVINQQEHREKLESDPFLLVYDLLTFSKLDEGTK